MGNFLISCPYCMAEFSDEDVHFRSERINRGSAEDLLPGDFEDFQQFMSIYNGPDKEAIIEKYKNWSFFAPQDDPVYVNYWKQFAGTTEENPEDKMFGVPAFKRKVLDPKDMQHRKYMVVQNQQNSDYFLRQRNSGMVYGILLTTGETCTRRVCPKCHNPLPDNYGLYPVKRIAIIGITGSGKTVYLSQMLKHFENYINRADMCYPAATASVKNFIQRNRIKERKTLPGATPAQSFQQPLIFEIATLDEFGSTRSNTIVMYDVAGELFNEGQGAGIQSFAKFISYADGVIMLIDPHQFEGIASALNEEQRVSPTTAIQAVRNQMKGPDVPLAVCISKSDEIASFFQPQLWNMILKDYTGVQNYQYPEMYERMFNGAEQNQIEEMLMRFMIAQARNVDTLLKKIYTDFEYFAITALGCRVDKVVDPDTGREINGPVGPIAQKRIADPLLWLFYRFGYISTNQEVISPAPKRFYCPCCNSLGAQQYQPFVFEKLEKTGFMKKEVRRYVFDFKCQQGHFFNLRGEFYQQ